VDYLRAKRRQEITAELRQFENRSQEERIERQCMESDADRRSIISRIDSLRLTFDSPDRPTVPWRPSVERSVEMIFDWAISINILFRLFGDVRFSRSDLVDSAYPPLPVRLMMCDGAALRMATTIWGAEVEASVREALEMAYIETQAAFATVLGVQFAPPGFESIKAAVEHVTELSKYWSSVLIEALIPYAYD
jgi:hypothetical protein